MTAYSFTDLPADAIGTILYHLNWATGSEGILNEADIPVAMRYAQNLACTSRTLLQCVSDPVATGLFLKSLQEKYGRPAANFAAQLNTTTTRKWLWQHICTTKLDEAYNAIQDMYTLSTTLLQEAQLAGFCSYVRDGRLTWQGPDTSRGQTAQGLFLTIHDGPDAIASPFGKIVLFYCDYNASYGRYSLSEVFIRRLHGTFDVVINRHGDGPVYTIAAPTDGSDKIRVIMPQEVQEISREDAKKLRGTHDLVVDRKSGDLSYYKIPQIGQKVLPEAAWPASRQQERSIELMKMMWEMLEKKRLGKDHLSIIKTRRTVKAPTPRLFTNILEISSWATDLLRQVASQPAKQGYKALTLHHQDSSLLARLLDYVNSHATAQWHLRSDDTSTLHYYPQDTDCALETLSDAHAAVLKSLGMHWTLSMLKDHPDIARTESEEDYVLFIKKDDQTRVSESSLIQVVARFIGIDRFVRCDCVWKEIDTPLLARPNAIYLWIRKDKLDHVVNALQLQLTPEDQVTLLSRKMSSLSL